MKKIDAFLLEKINKKLKLKKNINLPQLSRGQVLVKMIFTSLCGSQIMEISGKRGKDKYIPHGLGHEGLAKVVEIGPGVKKIKKNDKVILSWIKSKGCDCKGFRIKIDKNKFINFGPITTLSNYSIVSENRCVKKPKKLNDKIAAFFGCSIATGFGVVYNSIKKPKTKSIGIYGLGTVGLFSLIAAKCLNFKKIFVIEKSKTKKILAKKMGAIIINHNNPIIDLMKNNQNKLLDYCFESTGNIQTIKIAFDLIHNKGECYISSHPSYNKKLKINPHDLIKGKKIFGAWGGYTNPEKHFNIYSKILSKNKNFLKTFKIKTYKLKQINQAIIDLKNNKIIKPLIKC